MFQVPLNFRIGFLASSGYRKAQEAKEEIWAVISNKIRDNRSPFLEDLKARISYFRGEIICWMRGIHVLQATGMSEEMIGNHVLIFVCALIPKVEKIDQILSLQSWSNLVLLINKGCRIHSCQRHLHVQTLAPEISNDGGRGWIKGWKLSQGCDTRSHTAMASLCRWTQGCCEGYSHRKTVLRTQRLRSLLARILRSSGSEVEWHQI